MLTVPHLQLIVGLGNPGPRYVDTRHNAGVWALHLFAQHFRVELKSDTKFKGCVGSFNHAGQRCFLLEPTTFMNLSGESVGALARFYRIPTESICVLHDELDLPVGETRLKQSGGHAGHNGLKSIIAHLGSPDFLRLRIGIGRPANKQDVSDFVLNQPSRADRMSIDDSLEDVLSAADDLLSGNIEKAMRAIN